MLELMERFTAAEDPEAALDAAFDDAITRIVVKARRFDALRLIEVGRLAFLPMAPEGAIRVDAEASAARLELLALVALAAQLGTETPGTRDRDAVADQEMSQFVSEAKEELDALLRLAHMRAFAAIDSNDKLAMVSLLIQGAEVHMRNSSYPEMVAVTNRALLDGEPNVHAALIAELGFDANDALAVLEACHDLQLRHMNERMTELARSGFMSMFEPAADEVTVAVGDIVAHTGIAEERVHAVVESFRLDLGTASPAEVVHAFTTGKNPMRVRPLVVAGNGRIMLAHSALNVFSVRENLEEHLKTSTAWNSYAKHRGDLLETRTRRALERVLPDGNFRDAFEYYVPANDVEEANADPTRYTKRVEGDHLLLVDDVAIIVEDKAVALSGHSRGGKITRIRTDLTGIITKAAEQAGRMRDGIERDGGLRVEGEGWVDLSHVREIHTIAVSLDDLSTVMTATAELVRANVLRPDNIPWTVSLHDLELITELVARPAEFLLYLRRRRNSDVTVMFRAPDELDLFLYFFEAGLWVEPDPAQVRAAFPFLPEPTTAELRRHRSRQPAWISSRTDALDHWFHTKESAAWVVDPVPKPAMVLSPVAPLLDELQSRRVTGWLSIGATLLSATTDVQHKFARYGDELLDNPSPDGAGRSLTMPLTGSVDPAEGWLVVWATRPAGQDAAKTETQLRGYLRAKKHQLNLPRGVVLLYDEPTRDLVGIFYDGHIGPLDATLTATLRSLRPAADLRRTINLHAQGSPRRAASASRPKQQKNKRKR
ncbi:preprotein translocase subunit SecA [Embleya sp. NBC_00888]|uniref:preprotein translocase subunit SecA n=1 Tax=Embleya sp. NBC_00888 TaxID=2975960 RepID=UPI003868716B|nr:preprotein translocase subunit SecA [Embleya sp. NBC_00888]